MSVIYILWLRQIKRYYRSKARMIGSLAQPILFFIALGFGFGPTFQQAAGGDYMQFLAPGIISMSILFTSIFSGIDLIYDKRFGFLKETLVAPVSRLAIMFGRTLGGATNSFLQGVLVLVLTMFFGFRFESFALLPVAVLFMALIALFFTALGTSIASFLEDMKAFPLVMNFLVMPIFFLSGALFPLENLPLSIRWFSYIDPLSYGVDGIRSALTDYAFFSLTQNLLFLIISLIIIMILGSYLFKRIQI